MKILHPNGDTVLFAQAGTRFIAELEIKEPGWITIGYLGGAGSLLIDYNEWPAFVAMVAEINKAVKEKTK